MNFVGPNSFSIKPASVTTTGAQLLFEYTHRVWASTKVNFWVSSNPEIQVGFVDIGNASLIQPTSKPATNVKTVQLSMLTWFVPSTQNSTQSSESS